MFYKLNTCGLLKANIMIEDNLNELGNLVHKSYYEPIIQHINLLHLLIFSALNIKQENIKFTAII